MAAFALALSLDNDPETPVFLQIARAVVQGALRGRIRPGEALPGSRTLAEQLGVHRNTVLAAYRELSAEGWIEARVGGATTLSRALPDRPPRRFARTVPIRTQVPSRAGFDLPPAAHTWEHPIVTAPKGTLVLASGAPDLRLLPVEALARAHRRALRAHPTALLNYGDPRGEPRLREALARMLSSLRGLAATADTVMVTRGCHQALDLVARTLLAPGDVVAVEALGYPPAWSAFSLAGARMVAVPVDAQGMSVEALDALCARMTVKAVYLTPHHQYPTTVTLAPERRIKLLELARARRIAVLEDDYDHEFHYEGRPVLPLASADTHGVVVHMSTLSKVLAPGLRIGFVVAPAALLDRLVRVRSVADRQGDQPMEHAVAELIEDGELQRHVRKMRKAYGARREALLDAIARSLGGVLDVQPASGAMALWARCDPSVDVDAWSARCAAGGVLFPTGRRFVFEGRAPRAVRLGFAGLREDELREAVRRMTVALKA